MKFSLFSLAFASSAVAAVASTDVPTYSATVLIDRVTLLCTLQAPPVECQRHRLIKTSSDVLEQTKLRTNRFPEELLAGEPLGLQHWVTVLGGSIDAVETRIAERCPLGVRANPDAPGLFAQQSSLRGSRALATTATEIRKLVDSGDPKNRVDVVFMGDGYTQSEMTRFFDDMARLTNDMFTGDTYAQYLPLFNIWAAYVPSIESGVGINSTPKNTPFQLYRDGNELRGLFIKKPQVVIDICLAMPSRSCEFPAVIGNDDFYGGLASQFIIGTRSPTTGTMVLRHEMGHDFGGVGEEYDGGEVYGGVNSASSSTNVPWKHWLTNPSRVVEEQSAQLYQKHMWSDLDKNGAFTISFTSTGIFKRWYMQFSVSGADTDDALSVTLDGKPLPWKSIGHKDRTFYQYSSDTSGFSAGTHQLVIKGGGKVATGPIVKQLCNAAIYEYADEAGFKKDDPTVIGIYQTYNINKNKSYRPNNEFCLMRNMTSTSFCKVCQENLWLKFLARVVLIDGIQVAGRKVSLQLIPLGQFRLPTDTFVKADPEVARAEKYSVVWLTSAGQELPQFKDQFTNVDFSSLPAGTYKAKVTFSTPNIRKDTDNLTTSEKTFTLV